MPNPEKKLYSKSIKLGYNCCRSDNSLSINAILCSTIPFKHQEDCFPLPFIELRLKVTCYLQQANIRSLEPCPVCPCSVFYCKIHPGLRKEQAHPPWS